MKKLSLLSVTMTLVFTAFAITNSAKAELINRGGGLIYDTDINVTWLQDANYAKTSDYDTDGDMLYSQANAFIAYLNSISFLGYSNWRLPKADPSCSNPGGYDCTNSEMGHLSYTELGNTSAELATHSGPFTNLCLLCIYWTGTPFEPGYSYHFLFSYGQQGISGTADNFGNAYRVMVVRDGDVIPMLKEVRIDIKPGSYPNSINLGSSGVIPVAIVSSNDFNASTEVNPNSLSLAGAKVRVVGKTDKALCHEEDVNRDNLPDLVCEFENELQSQVGDSTAVLEGNTFSGVPIRGEDTIRIVP
jgi:hypothetical protein